MAWHKRLCKHVVIKKADFASASSMQLHRNEVEALKNVKSVYLPHIIDFLTDSESSYTVLEYIEGESFDKLLKQRKKFSQSQLSKWLYQLTSALVAIHGQNVCHRDIKPANIILTPHDDVCLIDFNSALVSGNNTGVISYSPAYASPEQCVYFRICDSAHKDKSVKHNQNGLHKFSSGSHNADMVAEKETLYRPEPHNIDWKLSDIYSLGATMYNLFIGKRPPEVLLNNPVIPRCSPDDFAIRSVIGRCMRQNPKERFPSADDLKSNLQKYSLFG